MKEKLKTIEKPEDYDEQVILKIRSWVLHWNNNIERVFVSLGEDVRVHVDSLYDLNLTDDKSKENMIRFITNHLLNKVIVTEDENGKYFLEEIDSNLII